MKKGFYIFVLIGCVLNLMFTVSCNDMPTYEELKNAEKKIIRKIISEKGIEVLREYPSDGIFRENEFVELNSGIYLNVVDSGNGNRPVYGLTDILIRVSGESYENGGDSVRKFNTFSNIKQPFSFKYGNAYGVQQEHAGYNDDYNDYFSLGLESILLYVGDSAVVKLIVPGYSEIRELNSAAGGSTYQNGNGYYFIPIYYDRVRYTFYK